MASNGWDNTDADSDMAVARLEREGDVALGDLFAQHRARLRRMVEMRLDNRVKGRVDPSDVLQEAFVDASKQLQGYLAQRPMPPFLWLRFLTGQRLMATHRHHLGAQMRDAKLEVPLDGHARPLVYSDSLSQHLAGRLTTPSRAVARLELQVRLREMIETLEPLDREILALRHFEELTNNEVALELGISKAAASNRYMRALVRLGKLVADVSGMHPG
jgi:RNA polymerase sigma-70 factor (ECF subfamily)